MNTFVLGIGHRAPTTDAAWTSRPACLRAAVILVCLAAMSLAATFGTPSTLLHDDPELAHLLRGMGLIKATIALAAMAVTWWRFGRPVSRVAAGGYVVGLGLMTGATVSIWELSSLLPAAVLFHAGLFTSLWVALRNDGMAEWNAVPALPRRARVDPKPAACTARSDLPTSP